MRSMFKRAAAAVLCFAICLSYASAGLLCVSAAQSATATIETVSAKPGETVSLVFSISQVDRIGGVGFYLQYDGSVLECTDAVKEGLVSQMEMSSANFAPVGHPNEIWLTGMSLNGVSGSGSLMTVTFRVKENAVSGFSAVTFTDKRQELYESDGNTQVDITPVNGGVQIAADAGEDPTPATDSKTSTTADGQSVTTAVSPVVPSTVPQPAPTTDGGAIVVTDASGEAVTRPDGAVVTVQPEVTVTRPDGTVETGTDGQTLLVPGAALVLSSADINPGGTVTLTLTLSGVTDITNISIHLAYDTKSMAFMGGEFTGFVQQSMSMTKVVGSTPDQPAPEAGDEIIMTAANSTPVSGSGVIAELQFRIYSNTPSGSYAVTFSQPPQLLMSMAAQIPTEGVAGTVRVEGEAQGGFENSAGALPAWVYVIIGIAAIAAIAVIVSVIRKKSMLTQQTASSVTPNDGSAIGTAVPMTDISEDALPEEASDDLPDHSSDEKNE